MFALSQSQESNFVSHIISLDTRVLFPLSLCKLFIVVLVFICSVLNINKEDKNLNVLNRGFSESIFYISLSGDFPKSNKAAFLYLFIG